ncbi:MAG: hypothetical protein EPN19_03270 [Betaproteobacteria bacterium]|nr:MAG: hypothetical protein EPN19_03270 [Betaproteobacteria bacterium]
MKAAKFTLMFLACAAAIPALAQNTTDSRCGTTNFDSSHNRYTILSSAPGTYTQQCFITVVPKESWSGGSPDLASSQLVEGNYDITLSGGGGGGGGGTARSGGFGYDGADAIEFKGVAYLAPGVYRVTIGSGGQGGQGALTPEQGGRGADGGPTSLSEAYSGRTIAGYAGAENWAGSYQQSYQVASAGRVSGTAADSNMTRAARSGDVGGGGRGASRENVAESGGMGGHGYIQLALKDPVPQAPQAQPAPAAASETVTTPPPAAIRPARRDRN